jgi:transposase
VGPQVLLPTGAGLVLEQVKLCGQIVHLSVRLAALDAPCPTCGCWSEAFHSSYRRSIADLPIADRQVVVRLLVPRFRCREKCLLAADLRRAGARVGRPLRSAYAAPAE